MAKFLKKPTNEFDQDLKAKGLRRTQELADIVAHDTGKKDADGNPIFTFGGVYREKIVPIGDEVKVKKGAARMKVEQVTVREVPAVAVPKVKGKQYRFEKAPRAGSKLEKAVQLVTSVGKDDKPACLDVIVHEMNVTKGNASIYFQKAKAIIEAGLTK